MIRSRWRGLNNSIEQDHQELDAGWHCNRLGVSQINPRGEAKFRRLLKIQ